MHQWSVRSTGIVAYLSTLNLVNYMSTDHQIDGCIENFDFLTRLKTQGIRSIRKHLNNQWMKKHKKYYM